MGILEDLQEIGLTEYEAKVYVALLSKHPATGYQLSKESGVPRSMVYEVLKRLHGRGIALETVESRATLYRPLPPNLLLDWHEAEFKKRVAGLRKGLDELFKSRADDRVWSISGRSAVLTYAGQLIERAVKETFLVLTDDDLRFLNQTIHCADDRGVEIKALLTGRGRLDCGEVVYHPPLESELQELSSTLLVVSDESEVLIASTSADMETNATITRNLDLVLIARQFVWMELFAQRVYSRLGPDLLARLDIEDRRIFESLRANGGGE